MSDLEQEIREASPFTRSKLGKIYYKPEEALELYTQHKDDLNDLALAVASLYLARPQDPEAFSQWAAEAQAYLKDLINGDKPTGIAQRCIYVFALDAIGQGSCNGKLIAPNEYVATWGGIVQLYQDIARKNERQAQDNPEQTLFYEPHLNIVERLLHHLYIGFDPQAYTTAVEELKRAEDIAPENKFILNARTQIDNLRPKKAVGYFS